MPDQTIFASGGETRGQVLNLAARHPDGQWILVYLGAKTTFSIHLDKLKGTNPAEALWIDPKSGRSVSLGGVSGTGEKTFTTPDGWDDAILIIEAGRG